MSEYLRHRVRCHSSHSTEAIDAGDTRGEPQGAGLLPPELRGTVLWQARFCLRVFVSLSA